MIKLRFSNPEYRVFKAEEKVVTLCCYNCELYDTETKQTLKKFKVKGQATCAAGDDYDETFGKKLSQSRAKITGYRNAIILYFGSAERMMIARNQCAKSIVDNMDFILLIDKLLAVKKSEIKHCKNLLSEKL